MRILVAEDDAVLAEAVQRTLRESGQRRRLGAERHASRGRGAGRELRSADPRPRAAEETGARRVEAPARARLAPAGPDPHGLRWRERSRARPGCRRRRLPRQAFRSRGARGARARARAPRHVGRLDAAASWRARLRPGRPRRLAQRRAARALRARAQSPRDPAEPRRTHGCPRSSSSRICANGARKFRPTRSRSMCIACARSSSPAACASSPSAGSATAWRRRRRYNPRLPALHT